MSAAMKQALAKLVRREDLPGELVTDVFREIMQGFCDPAQIGGLLLGLSQKRETMQEIVGAARAMREAVIRIPRRTGPLVDTCGTGGSGIARRNVSTAVALCLAACGVKVAKHGNRGASSPSGSADVLEALGVDITVDAETVGRCISDVGIGFLFAPALHPAMKYALGPRRALGVRTIFNLLGPLTNPAFAERQLLGVFDPSRLQAMAGALQSLGSERVWLVHGFLRDVPAGLDSPAGIDDLSPEGETLVWEAWRGELRSFVLRPEAAGIPPFPLRELQGGTPEDNAAALLRLLQGERGPYRQAVLYSGAAAVLVAGDAEREDLPACRSRIEAVLDDGSALRVLQQLKAATRENRPVAPAAVVGRET